MALFKLLSSLNEVGNYLKLTEENHISKNMRKDKYNTFTISLVLQLVDKCGWGMPSVEKSYF